MTYLRQDLPEEWRKVTPQELYDGIKARGYDWDQLLDTTPCWNFLDFEKVAEKKRLTTVDLIRMHLGLYHPFWMKDKPKAAA